MANEPENRWLFGYRKETRDGAETYIPNKCGHIFDCGADDFVENTVSCPVCGVLYDKTEGSLWTRIRPASYLDDYYTKWQADTLFADLLSFNAKLNIVTDLAAIRAGAAKGDTALQEHQPAIRVDISDQSITSQQQEYARINMGLNSTFDGEIDEILNS